MEKFYTVVVTGTDSSGETWSVARVLSDHGEEPLWDLMKEGMRIAFEALTLGKAIYGHPGVGCKGPYTIKHVLISESDEKHYVADLAIRGESRC